MDDTAIPFMWTSAAMKRKQELFQPILLYFRIKIIYERLYEYDSVHSCPHASQKIKRDSEKMQLPV